ncbi:TonB-dependent siderophore receptor [Acidimangrovimonas sediminis]|uniref:TonB-dependent siderophore receptor n=1 Tax=Acidimangrovimonas sediminis TaxID=2056283 RepID=UPI001E4E5731|nr:TonB-dependent receptor plug domain-containing protein [Acidimangrovimonas sediminis]
MLKLDDIRVEGSSYETEGTDSYRTDRISVGEKAAMSPREVPQSTVVITSQQIKDGGYTALNDAPGLMILNNDIGRSSIFSREFEFDYLYFDGLPAPVSSIYGTQPDLSIVDHVEVLKGPSGLFTATGAPAGAINMRLKQATRTTPGGSATVSANSNGQGRVELDYAGKLNKEGTLRGRFVLTYADGGGFVDMTKNGVTDGVVAVEHRLTGGTRLKFSLRQSYQSADFFYSYAGSTATADNQISRLTWLARDFSQHALALDAHAEIPFALGGWNGVAILGADYQRTTSTTLQANGAISGIRLGNRQHHGTSPGYQGKDNSSARPTRQGRAALIQSLEARI